jgi:hypothetical protein
VRESSWPVASAFFDLVQQAAVAAVYEAVLFAMTNAFLTGVTLKIDGGEPLT